MWLRRHGDLLGLLLVTTLAYWGVVQAGLAWDDAALVADNRLTGSLANLPELFRVDLWSTTRLPAPPSGYYRPLFLVSLAVDRALFGLAPLGHHLHSLAWHLACIVALRAVLRGLFSPLQAGVGTVVFALHPVQVESVTLIAARNDSMAAAFLLASFVLLLPREVKTPRATLAGILLLAGMLSKESTLLAPLLLLCLDLARFGRPGRLVRYAAMGAAFGVYAAFRLWAGVGRAAVPSTEILSTALEKGPQIVATYGALLSWPWPLTPARHLAWLAPLDSLWLPCTVTCLLLGWALARGRDRRHVLAGLAWAVLSLAPTLAATLDKGLLGERYLYLPMAGIGLVAAAAWRLSPRHTLWLLPVPLLAVGVIHARLPAWKNSRTLWEAALDGHENAFTHGGLAFYVNQDGDRALARMHYLRALEMDPPYLDTCSSLVLVHLQLDKPLRAARMAEWALEERGCKPTSDFMEFYAVALAGGGDWDRAVEIAHPLLAQGAPMALVVLAAHQARHRHLPGVQLLQSQWKGGSSLLERAARLLRLSGDTESAGWLGKVTLLPQATPLPELQGALERVEPLLPPTSIQGP
jgi:hypothetical protein